VATGLRAGGRPGGPPLRARAPFARRRARRPGTTNWISWN